MYNGSIVALVTPYTSDGDVDHVKLGELIEWHIQEGTDAIYPCGMIGESPSLTDSERCALIRTVVDVAKGKVPIIAGTGFYDTKKTVAMTQFAKQCGVDAVMVVTPYYDKLSQRGSMAHFMEIAKVGMPLVIYNHPGKAGAKLTAQTIAELAEVSEIVAVKEANNDVSTVMDIFQKCSLVIIAGADNLVVPFLAVGAVGCFSIIANIIPKRWASMIHQYMAGNHDQAVQEAYYFRPLCHALNEENSTAGIKYAMELLGLCSSSVRLPLIELSESSKALIRQTMINTNIYSEAVV